jgi:hypothetical protein
MKRIIFIFPGAVLLLTAGIALAGHILLQPAQLTPIVHNLAGRYFNAEVRFDKVEATLFSSFPSIGVRLTGGSLVKRTADSVAATGDRRYATGDMRPATASGRLSQVACRTSHDTADTLLLFASCTGSFDLPAFLRHRKIVVHRVQVEQPEVHVDIRPDGSANWDIFRQDTTGDRRQATGDRSQDTAGTAALPELHIRRVRIAGATIVYNDRRNNAGVALEGLNIRLGGRMDADSAQLRLQLDAPCVSVWSAGKQWCDSLPLQLSAKLRQEKKTGTLLIEKAQLALAGVDFDVAGSLVASRLSPAACRVNLDYHLQASSIPEALAHVPAGFSPLLSRLSTAGEVAISGSLRGAFGPGDLPVMRTALKLSNGRVQSLNHPAGKGIEQLEIDATAHLDFSRKTPSTVQLENLTVRSRALSIHAAVEATGLLTRPHLHGMVKGSVDFAELAKDFPPADSLEMKGRVQLDITGDCFPDDVLHADPGKIKAGGLLSVDSLQVAWPAQKLSVAIPLLRGQFGSHYRDTSRRRARDILFRGRISADSVDIAWESLTVRAGKWSASFSASPAKDSASIAPVFSSVRAENIAVRNDSLRVQSKRISGTVATRPLKTAPATPEYLLRFTLDTLRSRTPGFSASISHGKLATQAHRRPAASRTAAAGRGRLPGRQNTPAAAVVDMQLESQEAKTMLRQWNVTGNLAIERARVRTPHFPLRTQIVKGAIDFSADSVKLTNLQVRLGQSQVKLDGDIRGIRQALLNNRRITANFSMEADTINVNRMIRALAAGSHYSHQDGRTKDSIAGALLDGTEELPVAVPDTAPPGVWVVPRNIDLTLQAKIARTRFAKMELDRVNTRIVVRNQAVQVPDASLHSNIGDMRLALVYQARDPQSAELGLELFLHRIEVRKLIDAFPLFDTLTPMLRSLEGVVDCNMTGLSKLDPAMNVDFSTATASCTLQGRNLTLMDGETFSAIAKKLYFKNRQRNLIDSVSVELMLRDNYLLLFPFVLSIDRYQVAVGGTQYLDSRFDYHISILKWPVPLIKIGLNLTGTPDNMKIRPAKRLYSDLNDPVKKHSLYGHLFNVRLEMENRLKKDIAAIIDETPAARTRRRLSAAAPGDDTLRRRFFLSDTTD